GEAADVEEYRRRFPGHAETIAWRLRLDAELAGWLLPMLGCSTLAEGPPTGPPTPGWPEVPGYRVLGELGEGRGGMGRVFRVWNERLGRVEALKVIRQADATEEERARFRTESEAIARLQHPGVVQVFAVGEHQGRPFLALEFCPGGSLADRLSAGPL